MRRMWRWRLIAALGSVLIAWGAYRAATGWWYRSELARAGREIAEGRLAPARERLARLSASRPGDGEAAYRLGLCEEAAGAPDLALEAWARIAPDSPFAEEAAAARDRLLRGFHDRGRFSELEPLLEGERRRGGPGAAAASEALARLLRFEGRYDEVRRLLKEGWGRGPDPIRTLRDLWMLDAEPVPVEMVRGVLDDAARESPDDDRVWLGRANLATWAGDFDEADRLLSACQARRPDDPAVWRARLEWAKSSGRVDAAREALAHLPPGRLEPAEALDLRAWFARRRGDAEAERRALERLVEEDPGDARALERLATLATEAGQAERAGIWRRKKAYIDEARELYRKLLAIDATTLNLPTAARVAETLGRRFEAKGWWTFLAHRDPRDAESRAALARLDARPAPPPADLSPGDLGNESAQAPSPTIAPPDFRDEADAAGLRFTYDNGKSPSRHLPETMGGGVGLLDFDGDGWLDVYCIQGGPFPPDPARPPPGDRLFRNQGGGRFEDVTDRAGISSIPGGYGYGVAVGDYDDDGHPDLFLTRWRSYTLARNRGDGTFEDATEAAGLGGTRDWPTSAAFADLDNDGDLDLYVCHYVTYAPETSVLCPSPTDPNAHDYCDPRKFAAMPDHLFRNDGGRFVDATAEAGVVDRDGRGLGVVAADLDGDGRVDLYVANDTTANFLFRNLGGLKFEEVGVPSGTAAAASGGFQAGMGVACGDLDGDGLPDLAVTNFYGESTTLYRNLGGGVFGDQSAASGLGAASRALLGFGIAPLDYDDDGRLDLATANGHVNDLRPDIPYAMPAQLLAGAEGGRLIDVSAGAGPPWTVPRVGRGLAAGDLDNDGRVDLVLVDQAGPTAFLRNRTAGGRSLTLRLEGSASNRDAVGARVTAVAGGQRRIFWRVGGGSYLSSSDPRIHVGLGPTEVVETVEVAWPSGQVDLHRDLPAGGFLLREGEARPSPLAGFPGPGG